MSDDDNVDDGTQTVTDDGNDKGQGTGDGGVAADAGAGQNADTDEDVLTDEDIDAISDPDELKEKLKFKNKQQQKNWERFKDAQGFKRDKNGKWVKKEAPKPATNNSAAPKQEGNLSSFDTIAIINAGLSEKEDIDEVLDYAKMKKVSIADALKAPLVKSILAERKEFRETAEATNTGPTRRGAQRSTGKDMADKASKDGELPDNADDMGELAEARLEKKKSK